MMLIVQPPPWPPTWLAGVTAPDFTVHGTRGLRVVDSSVFPTNTGVNPQHAIMGVAMHLAKKLAANAHKSVPV